MAGKKGTPHKQPLTKEQELEVLRLAESGMRAKDIAPLFDRHYATIHTILNRHGIHQGNPNYKLTKEQHDEICQYYKDGATIEGLADTYKVCYASVHELLIRRGITRRRRSGKPPKIIRPRNCHSCGHGPLPPKRRFCDHCRYLKIKRKERAQYRKIIESGRCRKCCKPLDREGSHCRACCDKFNSRNAELKRVCFAHYGSKCKCCGLSGIQEFLTVDHVNNDGGQRRRSGIYPSSGTGVNIYKWLIKNNFPEGYCVLCWLCQWGKQLCDKCPCYKLKEAKTGSSSSDGLLSSLT